jgi:hypothetical protein
MDLGATVCRPRNPGCGTCPALAWCRYAALRAEDATEAGTQHPAAGRPTHRKASPPFPTTSRWLRGRIVDRLRLAEDDGWTVIEGPIGSHDPAAVASALERLARDGVVEIDGAPQGQGEGTQRVRLPIA